MNWSRSLIYAALVIFTLGISAFFGQVAWQKQFASQPPAGQASAISDQPSRMSESAIRVRTKQINAELEQLGNDHPWAGRYTISGRYTRESILLAPKSGFVYESH